MDHSVYGVTLQRRLLLDGRIHRMIPAPQKTTLLNRQNDISDGPYNWYSRDANIQFSKCLMILWYNQKNA